MMNRRSTLLGMLALPLLASCQSVNTEQTTTIEAVVETIDPVAREILLRGNAGGQSGALVTMIVSPHVQRLAEIHSGDRVVVTYYQALAAQMARPFSPRPSRWTVVPPSATRRPRSPVGRSLVYAGGGLPSPHSIRPPAASASSGQPHIVRTVIPKNPEVQQFVRGLSVGDQVDIVYQEAFAIEVVPMR